MYNYLQQESVDECGKQDSYQGKDPRLGGQTQREPLVNSSIFTPTQTFTHSYTKLFPLFDIDLYFQEKQNLRQKDFSRNSQQTFMSFAKVLQEMESVSSGADTNDDNLSCDGTSQPPVPSPRGQTPSLSKPSTNNE